MIFILTYALYRLVKSREHLRYKDPMIESIREDLVKLHPKARELTYSASDKSFTEDKKDMYLCLKDDSNQYYDRETFCYM